VEKGGVSDCQKTGVCLQMHQSSTYKYSNSMMISNA
jgi:hypothetical protein